MKVKKLFRWEIISLHPEEIWSHFIPYRTWEPSIYINQNITNQNISAHRLCLLPWSAYNKSNKREYRRQVHVIFSKHDHKLTVVLISSFNFYLFFLKGFSSRKKNYASTSKDQFGGQVHPPLQPAIYNYCQLSPAPSHRKCSLHKLSKPRTTRWRKRTDWIT